MVTAKPTLEERDVTYQSAVRFCEKNTQAILEIMDEDIVNECEQKTCSISDLKCMEGRPAGHMTLSCIHFDC